MLRQRAIQAEDKEVRRHGILDAAERLLRRQVERVPAVADVADEAGLAKGTVYLYFGSKEELFLALHDRAAGAFFSELNALLESASAVRFEEVFAVTRRHMVDAQLFLPLASRCLASMDHGISATAAAGFRERMGQRLLGAGERIEHRLVLPAGEGVVLLRHSYALIMGLWQMKSAHGGLCPASGETRALPSQPGSESPFLWDYATELERALRALWVGRIAAGRSAGVRERAGLPT